MNFVKATAIVFVLAIGVALVVLSASAQSPSAAPTANAPVGNIPEKPPQYWTAEGGTQGQWAALRQHCIDTLAEIGRRAPMSAAQLRGLPPIPGDAESCRNLSGSFSRAAQAPAAAGPAPAPSGEATPTPMDTPLPPELPVGPQSLEPDTSGPLTTGQSSFPGGGASACQSPPAPNVGAQTPPLDVAADVSPLQNVELLNQGLWVFNKSGTVQGNESLYAFWCGTVGANGQYLPPCPAAGNQNPLNLVDTQIAFDPLDSRWLATTLATKGPQGPGDLLFAVSTSASGLDGIGAWQRYDIPVCTTNNNGYILPDQPILGYSLLWAAVDVVCTDTAGDFTDGTDALVLVPNSAIVSPPQTLSPTIISPPLFASRPSRDVSGHGYPQQVLASAQFDTNEPPSAPPHVAVYGISLPPPGATPSPTLMSNSPNSWGFSGGGSKVIPNAPQTGCTVPSSNCMINVNDQDRIQQVTLQYNPTTGHDYLLTSFTAGYQSGAEALWYIFDLQNQNWAGQFTGTGNNGWVPTYTTITSDQNFNFYATATSFTSTGAPFSILFGWYEFPAMVGLPQTNFANSAAVYTGQNTCPTALQQEASVRLPRRHHPRLLRLSLSCNVGATTIH